MILGFMSFILVGALLLMTPIASSSMQWTSFENSLFTATSAVCVTGLVVRDTATYWSGFGQAVILLLIQIGGLGIITVTAFIAAVSGRKITLFQRHLLQDSLSSHQIGGVVRLMGFIFRLVFIIETAGAVLMMPVFCMNFGWRGVWMAFFHSISAFCNAGFDIMGSYSGSFSSLTSFADNYFIVIPICLLIISGGLGFLTWDDFVVHKFRFKRYRMQSKVILVTNLLLLVIPAVLLFFNDFASYPLHRRIALSLFQAVTPRTAGFNTADLTQLTLSGRTMFVFLMLIGGSPGSTAGGMKTTTVAVLFGNAVAVMRRKKSTQFFGRRIEDSAVKNAATLMVMYVFLMIAGALVISIIDDVPGSYSIFETASAVGTVGLTLGITPSLSLISHLVLIVLMFIGRVGGLTLLFAAMNKTGAEVSQYPVEKINVG